MPKGFFLDHTAARYLRYKQFLFGKVFPPSLAASSRFLPALLDCFEKGMALIRFLAKAVAQGKLPKVLAVR